MKKEKRKYLRLDTASSKKPSFFKDKIKLPLFWKYLIEGELKLSFPVFIGLSIACGALIYIVYSLVVKSQIISFTAGILSLSIPYLILKTNMMMTKTVDEAMAYKEFITILQSALRSNNSTSEVINAVSNEANLSKSIRKIMLNASANLRLGDSIEEVLDKAINESDNPYFKMAMTILKINHDVGSSATITALDNIQTAMNNVIDNTQLLKDKINGIIADKTIFLIMILAAPFVHNISTKNVVASFYSQTTWQIVYATIIIFAFVGQFIMEKKANSAIDNL